MPYAGGMHIRTLRAHAALALTCLVAAYLVALGLSRCQPRHQPWSARSFLPKLQLMEDEVHLRPGVESQHDLERIGGCSGMYVVETLEGSLPDGLAFADSHELLRIIGMPHGSGWSSVRIRVTDTSCTPFQGTTKTLVIRVQD